MSVRFTFLASRSYLGGIVLLPVIAAMNARSKRSSGVSLLPKSSGDKSGAAGRHQLRFFLFLASTAQQIGVSATTAAKPVSSPRCMY